MSMDKRQDARSPGPEAWETYGIRGYPSNEEMATYPTYNMASSSSGNSPFLGGGDDMSQFQSGLYGRQHGEMIGNFYRSQSRVGKSVDPKLLALYEFFRELFVRRRELFKNLFPGLHDEFVELAKKIGEEIGHVQEDRTRVQTLQRSLSVDSPRTPSNNGGEPPLRLERFKARPIVLDAGVPPGGQGSQGGGQGDKTKPGGSKYTIG